MNELSEYERGKLEGKTEARLDANDKRFDKINGSVERHAKSVEALTRAMQQGFTDVASEIRTMQEEARQRERDVKVAADTLAAEDKRRREQDELLREERALALEVPVRAWNLWANKATVVSVLFALLFGLATLYLALR